MICYTIGETELFQGCSFGAEPESNGRQKRRYTKIFNIPRPLLEGKIEARAGIEPTYTVLQTAT